MNELRFLLPRFLLIVAPLIVVLILAMTSMLQYNERQRANEFLHEKLDRLVKSHSIIIATSVWAKDDARVVTIVASMIVDPDVLGVAVYNIDGAVIAKAGRPIGADHLDLVREERITFATNQGLEQLGKLRVALTDKRLTAARHQQLIFLVGLSVILFIAVVLSALVAYRRTIGAPIRLLHAFRNIFENSSAAIFLVDLNGRFQVANEQFVKWFGCSDRQVDGKLPAEVLPAELADVLASGTKSVIETGNAIESEQSVRFFDGEERSIIITKFPVLNPDGKIVGVGNIVTNNSDLRAVEERLHQAQKMEAVGQLTGGIAHDFNNLLAVIQGSAELLSDGVNESTTLLQSIRRAARRGADLTQRLLAFSRQQALHPQSVNLQELVASMSVILERTLSETIRIETHIDPELWYATADPGQVENALLNLCINARDAMPNGGRLTITVANASLAERSALRDVETRPGEYVMLSVRDSGCGMSADVRDHAIEPFYTTKDVGAGSGLGLSMIYGFARQSAGQLSIASEEDRGTEVTIYLPRAEKSREKSIEAPMGEEPRADGETILVVEDDPDVLVYVRTALDSLGYRVVTAEDGHSGLAALARTPEIDLVLSDVVLPNGMSGPQMAEEARQSHSRLKFLFMSGYAENVPGAENFDPDNADILRKPFSKSELASKLRVELEKSAGTPGTSDTAFEARYAMPQSLPEDVKVA